MIVIFLTYQGESYATADHIAYRSGEIEDVKYRAEASNKAMEVDENGPLSAGGAPALAEQFALLKRAVKDAPLDYGAHLALVGYLRQHRPCSLDLLKAREE